MGGGGGGGGGVGVVVSMPITMPEFHLFSFSDFQVDDCLKIKSKTYDASLKVLFLENMLESFNYFNITMIPSRYCLSP